MSTTEKLTNTLGQGAQAMYSKISTSAAAAINGWNPKSNPANNGIAAMANQELLTIGNSLTGILSNQKLKLDPPQLVVVGSQSSGKSTVLNRIVEMDIMPTGKMMVTRTPLNLQLTNDTNSRAEFGDYYEGVWRCERSIKISTPQPTTDQITAIRGEIEAQTVKKAGSQKGISQNAIVLKIFAPNVPNLSLIDLPGMVAFACTDKGQPADIKDQINNLIGQYIQSERSIILLVMPARTDLETEHAFELVKQHDPHGERTVGILTKVDLMNRGTDIADYLHNNISSSLQLKYGYFAVRNPGTKEAVSSSMKQFAETERQFFANHESYSTLTHSQNRMGIANLSQNLSEILVEHIRRTLPQLLKDIQTIEERVDSELLTLGSSIPQTDAARSSLIHTLVANFCKQFLSALENRGSDLNYGRKLKDVFVQYRQALSEIVYDFTDDMINEAVTNCDGNHMLSLPSIEVLEYCLQNKRQRPMQILTEPSLTCVKSTNQILSNLVNDLLRDLSIARFPNLSNAIKSVVMSHIIYPKTDAVQTRINELISVEENYIWTDDPAFTKDLGELYKSLKPDALDTSLLRKLIVSYFKTVQRSLADRVPKTIMYYQVRESENEIYATLFNRIVKSSEDLTNLLTESSHVAKRRAELDAQKSQIVATKNILNSV